MPLFFLSGCKIGVQSQEQEYYKREGIPYGVTRGLFLGRWWDFYERGRSFADGSFWSEAENDLREAVSIRTKDDRRARTYGAHFIQYFGNRELGVVLFRQAEVLYNEGRDLVRNSQKKEADQKFEAGHQKIKKAIQYLKNSVIRDELSNEDILTEKAQYYLKQCYRQFSKFAIDNQAPVIHLNSTPTSITNDDQFELSGWVEDDNYIDMLSVNGKNVKLTYHDGRFYFGKTINLRTGSNHVDLEARDTHGNASQKVNFTITLDVDRPVISIIDATPEQITLSILNEQFVELKKDRLENAEFLSKASGNVFQFAPIDSAEALYVEFVDKANNKNGIRIQPEDLKLSGYRLEHGPERDGFDSAILLASTELSKGLLSRKLEEKNSPIQKEKSDKGISAPRIVVQKLENLENVYQEYLIISGRIKGSFTYFKINGQTKIEGGKDVRFSFKEKLELHQANMIKLEVADANGARCESCNKTFEITRHPSPEQIREFKAATVLYPLAKDGGDGAITQDLLWDLLVKLKQNGRFRIAVQDEDIQQAVNKENKLKQDGWIDASTAARFGKILNAEYSIACSLRPTQNDVEIYARLIDVKTKKTLASCDVYEYSEDGKDFENAYSRFIEELAQNFPVVGDDIKHPVAKRAWGGFTIFSNQKNLILEMGKDANIKEGMKFVAYDRADPLVDFETGEILVKGRVSRVGELFAKMVRQKFTYLEPIKRMKMSNARYVVSK